VTIPKREPAPQPLLLIAGLVACIVTATACGSTQKSSSNAGQQKTSIEERSPAAESTNTSLEQRLGTEVWHGDLDGIAKRRYLRVLVAPNKIGFYFDGSQMQGAIYDTVREFETFLNKRLNTGNLPIEMAFLPVARERLIPMLAEGKGDLVATLIGVSEKRQETVDFSDPFYDKARGIIVSGPSSSSLSRLEGLSGKEVYYFRDTIPFEKLTQISDSFKQAGKPPITLTPADESLQSDDLLEMTNAGLIPMTVAEDNSAQFWAKVFPKLQLHEDIVVGQGSLAWAIQKNTPQLKAAVNDFVQTHKIGTAYGNTVARKYLRDIDWVKNSTARRDLAQFDQLITFFRQAGDKYDLPYLLLAAQGYQESRLNPSLRSRAGAMGVMQIKPSTAAAQPIGIPDISKPDRNIEAGAKYLRYMVTQYYANEPMDRVTRGLFALASYNAGPAKIQKLRQEAAAQGYDPNKWFNNVEVIASKEIGRETVQYVSNIYKYYLAYEFVTRRDAERKAALGKRQDGNSSAK